MVRYYEYTAYKHKWRYIAIKQWLDTKLRQLRPFNMCGVLRLANTKNVTETKYKFI